MIEEARGAESAGSALKFTGNWFLDAGIIGFVNLMEDVYEVNLMEDIYEKLRLEKENFYYAYFAYYIRKRVFDLIEPEQKIDKAKKQAIYNEIKSVIHENTLAIKQCSTVSKEDVREKIKAINKSVEDIVKSKLDDKKYRILQEVDKRGIISYEQLLHNFAFNNFSVNKKGNEDKVLKSFEEVLFENKNKGELIPLNKDLSKFMFSDKEFPNLTYCKIPTLSEIDKITNFSSASLLLSFPLAFTETYNRNIFIYTEDMESSRYINKNLRKRVEKAKNRDGDISRINRGDAIFRITWESIIDYLAEQKSSFSLDNMYYVEYRRVQEQNFMDVEYIGIPKLQASIIIDDSIREKLNTSIQYSRGKSCWLIEEFIKERSLYPLILDHISLALNDENVFYKKRSSLYSLIVDAKILEAQTKKDKKIFSQGYFENYRLLVDEIKDEVRLTFFSVSLINEILNRVLNQVSHNTDEIREIKNRIARELLDAIKSNDKNAFLNILLRNLNNSKGPSEFNKDINNWIFDKVINNNICFERYELALVIGIISGGKKK